ncbi:hypothetical protein B0F90DRAFT_851969 [Multifurca ochricompacta]|uniref:Uncharacterized protein n=1 Tax=Multifurca ochricompacta TaxID=376703 RepID=A0AAD4LU59_9AGAM|nr:hypothetical protein B0F90DRAFT_851969 [Multifurca ochricompacta]
MISVSVLVLAFIPVTAWAVQVQNPNLTFPYDTTRDRESVIAIFNSSYDAYRSVCVGRRISACGLFRDRTYAFGHDQVAPLSRRPLDTFRLLTFRSPRPRLLLACLKAPFDTLGDF